MKIFQDYLSKQAMYSPFILSKPEDDLDLIIVIPAYKERETIARCIASIQNCQYKNYQVELIIVVNYKESDGLGIKVNSRETVELINQIIKENTIPNITIHVIEVEFQNKKKAGVGLARKIGMDEAVSRFLKCNKIGIISCLDADCTVAIDYISKILDGFARNNKKGASSIYFEHPLDVYNAELITQYELHLRYFIDIQRKIGLPFAYHTVGSSMAVRSSDYCRMGGMNVRKAGEDFYFLQKFIAVDNCFEINDTVVYPSGRTSDRVPFGTGKAVRTLEISKIYETYSLDSFHCLEPFIKLIGTCDKDLIIAGIIDLDKSLVSFLESQSFIQQVQLIHHNTNSKSSFAKRFFQWFNAFRLMKCLHHMRDRSYPDRPVEQEVERYLRRFCNLQITSCHEQLIALRNIQRTGTYSSSAMQV